MTSLKTIPTKVIQMNRHAVTTATINLCSFFGYLVTLSQAHWLYLVQWVTSTDELKGIRKDSIAAYRITLPWNLKTARHIVIQIWFRQLVAGLQPWRPGFDPGSVHVRLWWTQWHSDGFFIWHFRLALSVLFQPCSILIHSSITIHKLSN